MTARRAESLSTTHHRRPRLMDTMGGSRPLHDGDVVRPNLPQGGGRRITTPVTVSVSDPEMSAGSTSASDAGIVVLVPPADAEDLDPRDVFITLQSWEGYVLEIDEQGFSARLVDLSGKAEDEYADFSWSEVADFDRERAMSGAVFYWSVGQVQRPGGTRENRSQLRFRWMPVWRPEELHRIRQDAKDLHRELFED